MINPENYNFSVKPVIVLTLDQYLFTHSFWQILHCRLIRLVVITSVDQLDWKQIKVLSCKFTKIVGKKENVNRKLINEKICVKGIWKLPRAMKRVNQRLHRIPRPTWKEEPLTSKNTTSKPKMKANNTTHIWIEKRNIEADDMEAF